MSQKLDKNRQETIIEIMFNYQEALIKTGLTETQAGVYEVLLKFGGQPARLIQARSPFKRGLVYKALEQLEELNLVEKREDKGKVAIFYPRHPFKIKELAEEKHREAELSMLTIDGVLGQLSSDFNLVSGQPGVSFFEGVDGLDKVYKDIILIGKDILLFRSIYDEDHPELAKLLSQQIKRQVAKGIHTLALTPLAEDTPATILNSDEKNLVTRRIVPKEQFVLDSQIIIYGNKVAIISLKNKIISTIIDNEDINNTWRVIFNYIWEASKLENDKILAKIRPPLNQVGS